MGYMIGGSPGTVYTEADQTAGKCPIIGTVAEFQTQHSTGPATGTFILCKAGASQNLVNGHVVTIGRAAGGAAPDFVATIVAASGVAGGANTNVQQIGVAVCSITCSASMALWVQVYGRSVVKASVSQNPNVPLKIGTTAGVVTATVAASASIFCEGMALLNTSSVQGAIVACFLNWPKFAGSAASA
jgi:hypothetical protein